ncbi:hypothetical protein SAMN05661093_06479 [Kibdelosporangium aridum]|uniref:Uncharacterized protein n=2 Tax=Kibdelosporangium aridum TaxID=2030 RepID=A0A1W2FET3_KIBAR|nr:hypothetical protein SAMN05661093_06479 [Kibdelosporangium aridum]
MPENAQRFDWQCDGSYSATSITFKPDGTFTAGAGPGVWVIQAGMLTFQFDGIRTTYSSASSSGTGIQSTFGDFGGVNGCHLLLGPGSTLATTDTTETLGVDGR